MVIYLCCEFMLTFIVTPAWFFCTITAWLQYNSDCLYGIGWLDFVNILLLSLYTLRQSLFSIPLAFFTLCCIPFVCESW